ncbi:NAD(P)H-dependent oxidoreductase [uncultured Oscillibacter sp.]|uniref:NAD(P)H-dependent oxidoreductase n=1 Tax=uncultured Oscillibacter sp. TaxID=876091 RepID=UPI002617C6F3|nr:NAD(P)H-dependent oxidoreductase [uncultured Oscillibacter sp.]
MKLLFIDGCVSQRGPASRTRALAEAFLSAFRESHPGAEVETVTLEALDLKPFLPAALNRRDELASAGAFDAPVFDLARQFQAADKIAAAAPFWDMSFPAVMRIYIEHISANGLCYHYEADGCHGDCRADRLAYLTTSGDFERPESLGVLYWKQLSKMFGVPRFDYVFAGGLDVDPAKAPELLEAACEQARALGRSF